MRMDKVFLSIITVTGLCAVSSHAQRQYHVVYDLKTWTEAQNYCRETYTDLATIDNEEDVEMLLNMTDLSKMVKSNNQTWIGLYLDSGRWSLSDTSFYKPGETEFRRWASNQSYMDHDTDLFTFMLYGGEWYSDNFGRTFEAICADVRGPNVTFVLTDNYMTWTEAQNYCREHYTDLASVRNMTENQKIHELVPAEHAVWIGLVRDRKWSDGSNSSFRFWKKEQSDSFSEGCVSADLSHSGMWEASRCDLKRAFICYSPPLPVSKKMTVKVRLQSNPSVDLNDPAVMESILNQFKQRPKDQGINDNIRLSWKKQPDGKVFHKEKKKKTKKTKCPKKDEL